LDGSNRNRGSDEEAMSRRVTAPELWTIQRFLGWTQGRFSERGIPTARLDAEVLLAHALRRNRVALYTHFDQPLSADELGAYRELIKRRLAGEPVAYLIGVREFRSIELAVDPRVLIPRPDTETLVEVALELLPPMGGGAPRVVDIGTGSGALATALAAARPDLMIEAVDRSADAVAVAAANVARHAPRVSVVEGELLAPTRPGAIDLVVSNPPYIPTGQLASLQLEVQREPRLALDGGADGLDVVRRLIEAAVPRLVAGGALAVEIGQAQAEATAGLFAAAGLVEIARRRDLGGIERVVSGRRR
jgi:release factor glutamine methyltransferase